MYLGMLVKCGRVVRTGSSICYTNSCMNARERLGIQSMNVYVVGSYKHGQTCEHWDGIISGLCN